MHILTGQFVFCLNFLNQCCVKAKAREMIFSAVVLFNLPVGQISIHNAIIFFFLFFFKKGPDQKTKFYFF